MSSAKHPCRHHDGRRFFRCYLTSGQAPNFEDVAVYGRLLHRMYDPPADEANRVAEHFPFVIRRVETIKLHRELGDRRAISLDIDSSLLCYLSEKSPDYKHLKLPERDISPTERLIPIGIFPKQTLLDFDSRDSRRNLNLAARCISYAAGYAWLISGLPADLQAAVDAPTEAANSVRQTLWQICIRPTDDTFTVTRWQPADAIAQYRPPISDLVTAAQADQLWRKLLDTPGFAERLGFLYDSYFPFVVVRAERFCDGGRHMIKFAITVGQPAEKWVTRQRGLYQAETISQYGVLEGHSEHLRIISPPGIEFNGFPDLGLPTWTSAADLAAIRADPPRAVFNRRVLTIQRHSSTAAEPHVVRAIVGAHLSNFIGPSSILLVVSLAWLVAALFDWQFASLRGPHFDLAAVRWTDYPLLSVVISAASLAWTLTTRQAMQPLRHLLLGRTVDGVFATVLVVGATSIGWAVVAKLSHARDSLSPLTRGLLPYLTGLVLALFLAAFIGCLWMLVSLLLTWVFQRSLHKRTHDYVGVQQSMSLFPYDWANDKNTSWVEVDRFINDPLS